MRRFYLGIEGGAFAPPLLLITFESVRDKPPAGRRANQAAIMDNDKSTIWVGVTVQLIARSWALGSRSVGTGTPLTIQFCKANSSAHVISGLPSRPHIQRA
jgi:hypothetical protein